MKRCFTFLTVLLFILAAVYCHDQILAADSAGKAYVVGYSNLSDADVNCRITKDFFVKYSKDYPDMKVVTTDAQLQVEKQIADVESLIAQKVNVIIALPMDYEAMEPAVLAANQAGIPFIAFRAAVAGGKYTYCGSNDVEAGRLQAEWCVEKLPKDAKILYMSGTLGMDTTTLRMKGFKELIAAKRPDVKILAELDGKFDRAEGMRIMEDWIQSFPDFSAVVCANDQMALGAIEAMKGARRLEGISVLGVDAVEDALLAIRDGDMTMSAYQNANAQAKAVAEMAHKISAGQQVTDHYIPFEVVTLANVANYLKK